VQVFGGAYESIKGFFFGIYESAVAIIDKVKQKWSDLKNWFADIFSSESMESAANATAIVANQASQSNFGADLGVNGSSVFDARTEDGKRALERINGAPTTTPSESFTPSPGTNLSMPTNLSASDFGTGNKKIINVQAGAIQINASGFSVQQMKNLIREVLGENQNLYK